jgi:hypothetical protein
MFSICRHWRVTHRAVCKKPAIQIPHLGTSQAGHDVRPRQRRLRSLPLIPSFFSGRFQSL